MDASQTDIHYKIESEKGIYYYYIPLSCEK